MGLMVQVTGGTGSQPAGGVDVAGLARVAVGLLGGEPGGSLGGLGGLCAAFRRAGLGAAFDSWVGTGPNRPITAGEIESALGAEAVARLARSVGADPVRVAAGLAEVLPRVIDQLTPAGALPDAGGEPRALARRLLGRCGLPPWT
jgi:uncharacterized protein YidB (DUF937 family)